MERHTLHASGVISLLSFGWIYCVKLVQCEAYQTVHVKKISLDILVMPSTRRISVFVNLEEQKR